MTSGFTRRTFIAAPGMALAAGSALAQEEILARIKPPAFPERDFHITRYGADAGGKTDCSEAIRKATPDGRYVAFCSVRGGVHNIWRMDADGSNAKQITRGDHHPYWSAWSSDGQWIVYDSYGPAGTLLWRIPAAGGEPVQLTRKDAYARPAVSPDGKLIASFQRETGKNMQLAVIPFAGGQPIRLFDVATEPDQSPVRWTPDGHGLAYIITQKGVSNLRIQPVLGGPPQQGTHFKTGLIFNFDWSRDGKQLACARGGINSNVILISNSR